MNLALNRENPHAVRFYMAADVEVSSTALADGGAGMNHGQDL